MWYTFPNASQPGVKRLLLLAKLLRSGQSALSRTRCGIETVSWAVTRASGLNADAADRAPFANLAACYRNHRDLIAVAASEADTACYAASHPTHLSHRERSMGWLLPRPELYEAMPYSRSSPRL